MLDRVDFFFFLFLFPSFCNLGNGNLEDGSFSRTCVLFCAFYKFGLTLLHDVFLDCKFETVDHK